MEQQEGRGGQRNGNEGTKRRKKINSSTPTMSGSSGGDGVGKRRDAASHAMNGDGKAGAGLTRDGMATTLVAKIRKVTEQDLDYTSSHLSGHFVPAVPARICRNGTEMLKDVFPSGFLPGNTVRLLYNVQPSGSGFGGDDDGGGGGGGGNRGFGSNALIGASSQQSLRGIRKDDDDAGGGGGGGGSGGGGGGDDDQVMQEKGCEAFLFRGHDKNHNSLTVRLTKVTLGSANVTTNDVSRGNDVANSLISAGPQFSATAGAAAAFMYHQHSPQQQRQPPQPANGQEDAYNPNHCSCTSVVPRIGKGRDILMSCVVAVDGSILGPSSTLSMLLKERASHGGDDWDKKSGELLLSGDVSDYNKKGGRRTNNNYGVTEAEACSSEARRAAFFNRLFRGRGITAKKKEKDLGRQRIRQYHHHQRSLRQHQQQLQKQQHQEQQEGRHGQQDQQAATFSPRRTATVCNPYAAYTSVTAAPAIPAALSYYSSLLHEPNYLILAVVRHEDLLACKGEDDLYWLKSRAKLCSVRLSADITELAHTVAECGWFTATDMYHAKQVSINVYNSNMLRWQVVRNEKDWKSIMEMVPPRECDTGGDDDGGGDGRGAHSLQSYRQQYVGSNEVKSNDDGGTAGGGGGRGGEVIVADLFTTVLLFPSPAGDGSLTSLESSSYHSDGISPADLHGEGHKPAITAGALLQAPGRGIGSSRDGGDGGGVSVTMTPLYNEAEERPQLIPQQPLPDIIMAAYDKEKVRQLTERMEARLSIKHHRHHQDKSDSHNDLYSGRTILRHRKHRPRRLEMFEKPYNDAMARCGYDDLLGIPKAPPVCKCTTSVSRAPRLAPTSK